MMFQFPNILTVTLLSGISVATAFHQPGAMPTNFARIGIRHTAVSPLHASPSRTDDDSSPSSSMPIGRRSFHRTLTAAATTTLLSPLPSHAETTTEFTTYTDKACSFRFDVPSAWDQSEQTLPDRRRIVFFIDPKSPADDKNLIFVAYTPIRDDFTSLASFGSVEQIAQQTILPKGSLDEKTENEMLSADGKKDAYFFDYVSQPAGQPKRHFRTIFMLAPGATGGAGSVLVTITAQTLESNYESLKPLFDSVVKSYAKSK